MKKEEFEAKRSKFVQERVRLLARLEAQGDFPDKKTIAEHDENKNAIMDLDAQYKAEFGVHTTAYFEDKVAEHTKTAEESRIRVNKFIASRDPNRPNRYAEKRNKLQYDLQLLTYRIGNLKEEHNQCVNKAQEIEKQIAKLDKDFEDGEPTI